MKISINPLTSPPLRTHSHNTQKSVIYKSEQTAKSSSTSIIIERNARLLVLYVSSHNITSPLPRICVPYVLPPEEGIKRRRRRYCLLKRTHEVFLDYVNFSKGCFEEKGFLH